MIDEKLQTYLADDRPTVILTTPKEKTNLEKRLLQLSGKTTVWHVQVMTLSSFLAELFLKHRKMKWHALSKAEGLMAVYRMLRSDHWTLVDPSSLDGEVYKGLLQAFEIMSDLDLSLQVEMDELSEKKWRELQAMYACFKQYRQGGLFESERLLYAIPLLDREIRYVDFTHRPKSRSWSLFQEACQMEALDELSFDPLERPLHLEAYEVQFWHQEMALLKREISNSLMKGVRYQDIIVYFPDMECLRQFAEVCPYPCEWQPTVCSQRDLAFLKRYLKALKNGDEWPVVKQDETWCERMRQALTHQERLTLLADIVDARLLLPLRELADDLPNDVFAVLSECLLENDAFETKEGDRIVLTTYQQPVLAKSFSKVLLCGLNEDVFPSKINDKGWLSNQELRVYYGGSTPLDEQNAWEWHLAQLILAQDASYVVTAHYNELDGTACLTSLLFQRLAKLAVHTSTDYPLDNIEVLCDDTIGMDFEANSAKVKPLDPVLARKLYSKQGKLQVSPSQLECFNACPFRHYLRFGLHLIPPPNAMESKRRLGNLTHDLLDACADLFKAFPLTLPEGVLWDDYLDQYVGERLAQMNFVPQGAEERYLYEQTCCQLTNVLKVLLHHLEQGEFQMAFHEKSVSLPLHDVLLSGRIDRADLYQDYVKILDYKSSNKKLELDLAIQGFNMQMLLYLGLLTQQEKLKKGAVLYFNTASRKLSSDDKMTLDGTGEKEYLSAYQMEGYVLEDDTHQIMHAIDCDYPQSDIVHIKYVKSKDAYTGYLLDETSWENLIQAVFAHAESLVKRCLDEGDIAIAPAGSSESALNMKVSPCRFCDYQMVCLRDPFYHDIREIKTYTKEDMARILQGGKDHECDQQPE